jgi:hypothetical protein
MKKEKQVTLCKRTHQFILKNCYYYIISSISCLLTLTQSHWLSEFAFSCFIYVIKDSYYCNMWGICWFIFMGVILFILSSSISSKQGYSASELLSLRLMIPPEPIEDLEGWSCNQHRYFDIITRQMLPTNHQMAEIVKRFSRIQSDDHKPLTTWLHEISDSTLTVS